MQWLDGLQESFKVIHSLGAMRDQPFRDPSQPHDRLCDRSSCLHNAIFECYKEPGCSHSQQHRDNYMANGAPLTLSEMQRIDHISIKEYLNLEANPNLNDLIGCIFWLRAADQVQRHLRCGPNTKAFNHPCIVVDVVPGRVGEVQMFRICIVSDLVSVALGKG